MVISQAQRNYWVKFFTTKLKKRLAQIRTANAKELAELENEARDNALVSLGIKGTFQILEELQGEYAQLESDIATLVTELTNHLALPPYARGPRGVENAVQDATREHLGKLDNPILEQLRRTEEDIINTEAMIMLSTSADGLREALISLADKLDIEVPKTT